MSDTKIILKNWSIVADTRYDYYDPLYKISRLQGNSYGDPRRSAEGNFITTGPIEELAADLSWARTANTYYALENMDEHYHLWLEEYRKNKNV